MFTQCSKCETVFRLSAEVLRKAGGQVRCGKCGEVFNALARLAEKPGVFAVGESALDLETRADRILQSAPAIVREPADTGESDTEIAHLELQPEDADAADAPLSSVDDLAAARPGDETSLEFTLPSGDLDRIFVEDRQTRRFLADAAESREALHAEGESDLTFRPEPEPLTFEKPAAHRQPPGGQSRALADVPARTGLELSEDLRREVLARLGRPDEPPTPTASGGVIAAWSVAALLGALLLGAQLIHQNREWLSAHEPYGAPLRALYAAMGAPLPAPLNLSVYQLRQWGVTGDPGADGTLRVRASILNAAANLQPYPELRVSLADRFGNRIGSRDFEPTEYLSRPTARLMAPGERADATLEIQDPGRNAEGFELDVCLRGPEQRVLCANDAMAHAR
jgi:predicted Zn finger-like uncharacterized protein